MSCACGCGRERHEAPALRNRPGLDAIAYRAGTHGSLLATMIDRLTTHRLLDEDGTEHRPLLGLTARSDDAAIALLDAWAVAGAVLSFYTERIANEGYLRTATERRSLLELGRLTGHALHPPLGASVQLAFTIADDPVGRTGVRIARGTRAQSVPGPGETPQTYETSGDLDALPAFNQLRPRTDGPPTLTPDDAKTLREINVDGLLGDLRAGDRLLFEYGDAKGAQVIRELAGVVVDPDAGRTTLRLVTPRTYGDAVADLAEAIALWEQPLQFGLPDDQTVRDHLTELRNLDALIRTSPTANELVAAAEEVAGSFEDTANDTSLTGPVKAWAQTVENGLRHAINELNSLADESGQTRAGANGAQPPAVDVTEGLDRLAQAISERARRPGAAERKARDPRRVFAPGSDALPQVLAALRPELQDTLRDALAGATLAEPSVLRQLWVLRLTAAPFGAAAPRIPVIANGKLSNTLEWKLDGTGPVPAPGEPVAAAAVAGPHSVATLTLDTRVPDVHERSWVVLQRDGRDPEAIRVARAETVGVAAYNLSGTVSRLHLEDDWLSSVEVSQNSLGVVREVAVHLSAQVLRLSDVALPEAVEGGEIELDRVYPGLTGDRELIVVGERTDLEGVTGVRGGEVVRLAGTQLSVNPGQPGDGVRTVLELAGELRNSYKRNTVVIWGNAVGATQGESVAEVLGSGSASQTRQSFTLSQRPLTYLPSPAPSGVESTLVVRVDDVRWTEAEEVAVLGPTDRAYVIRRDATERATTVFGDGVHGARLPSSPDNVRATYRHGGGAAGNVPRGRVTQLMTRPLGVSEVVNPLTAGGGADPESVTAARRTVPLSVTALDRVVSLRDYEDFAANRVGIGKARADRLTDHHRQVVHVTVSGADEAALDPSSELVLTLRAAFAARGDPQLPLHVDVRELALIVIVASIAIEPDRTWESVSAAVRQSLLDALGYDRRGLGQDVLLSEVVAAAQRTPGVGYVDVDGLALIPEDVSAENLAKLGDQLTGPPPPTRLRVDTARFDPTTHQLRAAQLAILSAKTPDTLILRQR